MSYVHYGCGLDAPDGWINFDASPTLRIQRVPVVGRFVTKVKFPNNVRYGDIVKGLPVPDRSAKAIYCSHVLEHLAVADFRKALVNTLRLLKPGGIFRLVVPDLRVIAVEYMKTRSAKDSMEFVYYTRMGEEIRPGGLRGLLATWLGNERHRWMWDVESMHSELVSAGFKSIREAKCGDSSEPMFKTVENPDRWIRSVGMECVNN